MRTCIVALCIIGYALAAQGQPLRTSYCLGNNDGATTCSSCLNQGTQARQFATNSCLVAIANKVTDCKTYNPSITATKAMTDCIKCDGKDWMNITGHATAASIVNACSNTALVAATCSTKITNCDQSFCHTTAGATTTAGCRVCDSSYKGSGTLIAGVGYASCVAQTVANCDIGNPFLNTACYDCKSGYAVATDGLSCVAFTTDSNCRQLGTGNTYCSQCDDGYIFNLLVCESSAKLVAVFGLALAAFFFN